MQIKTNSKGDVSVRLTNFETRTLNTAARLIRQIGRNTTPESEETENVAQAIEEAAVRFAPAKRETAKA